MAYVLIHFAVATALLTSAARDRARGFILDDDDKEVRAGTVSFTVSQVVQYGVATYCVTAGFMALFCV